MGVLRCTTNAVAVTLVDIQSQLHSLSQYARSQLIDKQDSAVHGGVCGQCRYSGRAANGAQIHYRAHYPLAHFTVVPQRPVRVSLHMYIHPLDGGLCWGLRVDC